MKQGEINNILLHLLLDARADIAATRDVIVSFLASAGESLSDRDISDRMRNMIDEWEVNQKEYKNALIASLRNQFDQKLGSIDDLLNQIDPLQ